MRVALVSRDPKTRDALTLAFMSAPTSWEVCIAEQPATGADAVVCGPDVTIPGAVAFDPSDPAAALDAVRRAAPVTPRCRTYLFTGASGGCGTTSLALAVCRSLAGTFRTCFVDLDDRHGCAARLGLPEGHLNWLTDDELIGIPVAGFRVFASPSTDSAPPGGLLDGLIARFERVVIDAPVAAGASLPDAVTGGVVVIQPTLPNAMQAARLIPLLPDVPLALVTSRVGPGGECTRGQLRERAGRKIDLEFPLTPRLRDAEDDFRLARSRPLCRWTARVHRLVRALETV